MPKPSYQIVVTTPLYFSRVWVGDLSYVTVKVMPTDNEPCGIAEVGLPPVAPAVANALAKLTGKRLRTLPFPETV